MAKTCSLSAAIRRTQQAMSPCLHPRDGQRDSGRWPAEFHRPGNCVNSPGSPSPDPPVAASGSPERGDTDHGKRNQGSGHRIEGDADGHEPFAAGDFPHGCGGRRGGRWGLGAGMGSSCVRFESGFPGIGLSGVAGR